MHPVIETVERYYTLFNRRDWSAIVDMLDLPTAFIKGLQKVVLENRQTVTALYRGLGEKFAQEGAARLSWDRRSFAVFHVHEDLAVVKTVLTRETADGVAIKTWNCSYTLRLAGKDWLFTLITSDDVGTASQAE